MLREAGGGEVPRALGLLHGPDLVLQVSVLPSEILDVVSVTPILPSHEGDILTGLLQDLGSAALVSLVKQLVEDNFLVKGNFARSYLECWNGVLQPAEAVLDVVPPLPLQLVVMGSLAGTGQLRWKAKNIIFVLKQTSVKSSPDHIIDRDHTSESMLLLRSLSSSDIFLKGNNSV